MILRVHAIASLVYSAIAAKTPDHVAKGALVQCWRLSLDPYQLTCIQHGLDVKNPIRDMFLWQHCIGEQMHDCMQDLLVTLRLLDTQVPLIAHCVCMQRTLQALLAIRTLGQSRVTINKLRTDHCIWAVIILLTKDSSL